MEKTNDISEIDIYKCVDLIVEVTDVCNKDCPGNYKCNLATNIDGLRSEKYKESLINLKENSLIALRGGEPTMVIDWFEKFIEPALILNKNLFIIIETNGYFIDQSNYKEIINKLYHQNVFVRISFDNRHIFKLNDELIRLEFEKMAFFAEEALIKKINFGFYSLGMDKDQIYKFIKSTPLEKYIEYFHTLIKYDDISKVVLKGKYLTVDGRLLDSICKKL